MRWYRAASKVNLRLRVGPPGDDGFHPVATLMATLSWFDALGAAPAGGEPTLELREREGEGLGPVADNLVLRAARAFLAAHAPGQGARLVLEKDLPAGAGLGGGSADAAATLVALRDMHRPELTLEALRPLAAGLGSDVAFFLGGPAALCTGRGERVEPVAMARPLPVIVAVPEHRSATGPAYAALDAARAERGGVIPDPAEDPGGRELADRLAAGAAPGEVAARLVNDFEELPEAFFPGGQALREALRGVGALRVLLSGSGSARFGVFPDEASRDAALETLLSDLKPPRALVAATLGAVRGVSVVEPGEEATRA